ARSRCLRCCFVSFFFSSRRRHTRSKRDWSSDVCSSDLGRPQERQLRRTPRDAPRARGGEGRRRHDPQEPPRSGADAQAQGLRRLGAPALRPEPPDVRDHPGRAVSARVEQISPRRIVAENTVEDVDLTEYSTETPASEGLGETVAGGRGQSITAPGAGVGRRKQAVARVRLVPGTGEWTINGRDLETYFPNKLHQQLVNEPLRLLDLEGRFDVIVLISGGGPSGQAGAVRLGVARALNEIDRDSN